MKRIKIYDYSQVLKNTYFLSGSGKVVLVNLDDNMIKASNTPLWMHYILVRYCCKQIERDSQLYKKILSKYQGLLGDLVLPHRYEVQMTHAELCEKYPYIKERNK